MDRNVTSAQTAGLHSLLDRSTTVGRMRCAYVCLSILLATLLRPLQGGTTNPDDVNGLRLFYSRLNSPPLLTGWNESASDPCSDSWKGITCDMDGSYVTQIELPGLMLNGSLSWSSPLNSLQNLRVLDLSNNKLRGVMPYNLPRTIELLNLQSNQLSRGIPWSVGLLVSLTELRLAHNNLTGTIPNTFVRLVSLITLDLSDNGFTGSIPRTLRKLPQLSFLYLQGNEIDSGLDVLSNLSSLQAVDIRDNAFHGEEIPSQLWAIPNFQFSADEFPNNSSLPLIQFNLSLTNSPAPSPLSAGSPPESRTGGPLAVSPHWINATEARSGENFSFWSPKRIAGVTVVSSLAILVSVLTFLLFKVRQESKEFQNEDFDMSWLGPRPSNSCPCPRLVK